jgi:uncharacterized membrane protein
MGGELNQIMTRSLRDNLDFLILAGLSCVLVLVVFALPAWASALRVFFSLVFVLVAPGYALGALLFPKQGDIDGVERLVLGLGLSVVVVPLVGLLFNYTPWGIRLLPMTLGLALFTVCMVAAAYLRRRGIPPEARFFSWHNRAELQGGIWLLGLVALSSGAVIVAVQTLRPPGDATEFYMLGAQGRLQDYPTALSPGQTFTLTLGIRNYEGDGESYRIRAPFTEGVTEGAVVEVPPLERGEVWEQALTLRAPEGSGRTQLTFELYRAGDAEPYRVLHLFVMLAVQPGTLELAAAATVTVC